MAKNTLSRRSISLTANIPRPIEVDGEFFVIESASGAFQVRIDGGEYLPGEAYVRRRLPNPDKFSRLTFLATGAVTLTIVHGAGDYDNKKAVAEIPGPITVNEPAGILSALCQVQPADTNVDYSNVLSLSVYNPGPGNITVQGSQLASGQFVAFPMAPRMGIVYNDINVTTPVGTEALVSWVIAP